MPAGAWARRSARSSVGTASQANGAPGESVRAQMRTVRAVTRSTPVPLQQPAQRQAVQVLDSTWSPGAILSPFHRRGAQALHPARPQLPTAAWAPQ